MKIGTKKIHSLCIEKTDGYKTLLKLSDFLIEILFNISNDDRQNFFLVCDINGIWHKEDISVSLDICRTITRITANNYHFMDNNFLDFIRNNFDTKNINGMIQYTNFWLEILSEIKQCRVKYSNYYSYHKNIPFDFFESLKEKEFLYEKFETFIDTLKYFSLNYDKENRQIITTEHYELINNISIHNLSSLIYKIKSSNKIEDMENAMSIFGKEMYFILENNSKFREKKYITDIYKDNFLNLLKRQCNSYFRHGYNDSGRDKEIIEEWIKMDPIQKKNVIDNTLTYYLSILSILRDNNDIEDFIKSFNKNNNCIKK